jgi:membrane-associated protease RseP (regulator of RpoE activity)
MKEISCLTLMLLIISIGYSQKQVIQDPYSGMEMELSNDKQFLTISFIKTGTPADLAPLRIGDEILTINERKVSEIPDCGQYFQSIKENSITIGVKRYSETIIPITVQRTSVDLFSKNLATEGELYNIIWPVQLRCFSSDISTEKPAYNHLEQMVQSSENPEAYSISELNQYVKCCYYSIKKNVNKHNQITILGDESKNIADFKTFDFDYTSTDDPLMEKTLLYKLENQLLSVGLKKDTGNPDMLIIISFYSGQKEQYVPPQQIVSTKIQSYFNWYWGYIPVPVTESTTFDGYTKVTYLTNINLKFLDAHEIETSKVPPIVWSASFSEVSPEKTFLSDCANEVYSTLLLQFPKVIQQNCENLTINTYTYTGILYDKNNPSIIAGVIPGSPADEMGIQTGDEIVKISSRKLPENLNDNTSIIWKDRSDYKNALKYLFNRAVFNNGNTTIIAPLTSEYEEYMSQENIPLEFELKRSGKKLLYQVTPEYKRVIFFENIGFTIE